MALDALNAYQIAGIALMGAGGANFALNARWGEAFAEHGTEVVASIIAGDLLALTVFVGLGYLVYKRGDKKNRDEG
ncbi:hypothetical protein QA600_09990 [Natronococcus sp. A-GB1]|uniref:hypothetical protein n=1 Tax=Natronococcus sp. A-GB1 TaxID=3037648 RepID=UPI00241DED6A|nr:hypothetical protein [Natronococcus sp. A-GB1]MDG5759671.1 hypothetical protein [Natronococcus sp. A-GB1]